MNYIKLLRELARYNKPASKHAGGRMGQKDNQFLARKKARKVQERSRRINRG